MDRSEQEAFGRTAIKMKYCKGAKHYRFKLQKKNVTKINSNEKFDDLLETPGTSEE